MVISSHGQSDEADATFVLTVIFTPPLTRIKEIRLFLVQEDLTCKKSLLTFC